MSPIVTIAALVRDLVAMEAACQRLEFAKPIHGKAKLLEKELGGILLNYPIGCFRWFAICRPGRSITTPIRCGMLQRYLDRDIRT